MNEARRRLYGDVAIVIPARWLAAATIGDQRRPVAEVAAAGGMSWQTTHEVFAEAADAVLAAPLRPLWVLGIDEPRRGKPRRRRDADGTTVRLADTRHTGLIDISGEQRLLSQVEGRACDDVLAWLAPSPPPGVSGSRCWRSI
jgi:transposase